MYKKLIEKMSKRGTALLPFPLPSNFNLYIKCLKAKKKVKFSLLILQKTTRDLVIEDCRGNTISAMTLFTLMFSHLKSAFVKQLDEATKGVPDDWIRWVITVPAIWDDSAKQFIREAAEKVVSSSIV